MFIQTGTIYSMEPIGEQGVPMDKQTKHQLIWSAQVKKALTTHLSKELLTKEIIIIRKMLR